MHRPQEDTASWKNRQSQLYRRVLMVSTIVGVLQIVSLLGQFTHSSFWHPQYNQSLSRFWALFVRWFEFPVYHVYFRIGHGSIMFSRSWWELTWELPLWLLITFLFWFTILFVAVSVIDIARQRVVRKKYEFCDAQKMNPADSEGPTMAESDDSGGAQE